MNLNIFIEIVKPYTMTSVERITELYDSLEYIRLNQIDGDLVECGVWKAGNILGMIEYLEYHKITNKKVWLYDTFNGMTQPKEIDVDLYGRRASNILNEVLCLSTLDEVKSVLSKSNFNKNNLEFVVGDVCETLLNENNLPKTISILRLDTDWYESTKKELEVLYPKLSKNGVLIIDDYGHWSGAKKATDEYFLHQDIEIKKIDYTGIKLFKK